MREWREQGVVDRAATSRAEAIEDFAAALRELRASVGTPSFREMSGRSHAISHTTLHEAAQGHRFPSWATTAEFVKACGADPAEYRERWEQAGRAIRNASASSTAFPTAAPPHVPPELNGRAALAMEPVNDAVPEADADDLEPAAPGTSPRRSRYLLSGAGVVGVLAMGAVIVGLVRADRDVASPGASGSSSSASAAARPLTPADCPVHQANPPVAAPAHPGDASVFIGDITLGDCSHVRRGRVVTKVWRLKNVGTVAWVGRSLHRLDMPQRSDECQTITDVRVPDTEPGETVDVAVDITAPNRPRFCFVRFKMQDAAGNVAFPGRRPVNFQLIVD